MRTLRDPTVSCRQSDDRTPDPWRNPSWAGDRRSVRRLPYREAAAFRLSQRKPFEVEIANLSTHGCAVKSGEPQTVGDRCWITLPTLESWSARVAWCEGGVFGLDFSRPLHRAVAEMIVERTEARLPWASAPALSPAPSTRARAAAQPRISASLK